ncbi:SDR family NAD(P)-dependent oxidoreductase [Nioella sp.]|uniref:SDR family NAD(P)-dependent oxidoreductase n=1 Tax=Nioella sp. TaxID=1912091 RepID=UPI003A89C61B
MPRLVNKVAAITGAAQGIGAAFAIHLAKNGAKVVVSDIADPSATVDAIKAAGGEAVGLKVDVTSNDDLARMVEAAKSEFGGLDILVNNAGIFATLKPKPFMKIDEDEFDMIMTVNARSVHQATKAVVPAMIERGGGKVVNISSGTFYYGPPGLSHYTASKGAIIGMTRCHGRELGDKNIQVNAIAPGLTESEGVKANEAFNPFGAPTVATRSIKREMVPEDLLGTLIYLCSDDSNFVTGQTLNVDGGKVNV